MKSFELRHHVGFEDTNVVGNVYFVNHLRWQGRCREMFLREFAPEVLNQMADGLRLMTTRCSCEYLHELSAFDEVVIRMRLGTLAQSRITLTFEYWRLPANAPEELVARGEQQIVFMQQEAMGLVPAPVPRELRAALREFGGS